MWVTKEGKKTELKGWTHEATRPPLFPPHQQTVHNQSTSTNTTLLSVCGDLGKKHRLVSISVLLHEFSHIYDWQGSTILISCLFRAQIWANVANFLPSRASGETLNTTFFFLKVRWSRQLRSEPSCFLFTSVESCNSALRRLLIKL